MATLTVLKFETAIGAENALEVIEDLSNKQLINLQDAAIVTWPVGKKNQNQSICLISFIPLFGLVVGATIGALAGSMTYLGINEDFIKSIRRKMTEGTSTLFLMTSNAVEDRIVEAMKQSKFEIIATNLAKEEEAKLHAVFGEE